MTVHSSAAALEALENRLLQTDPGDIVSIKDFDLTLAEKPEKNFHYVTLSEAQRAVLADASASFAATIILTARGEASTLSGLFGDSAAFNTCLASNCGHHVLVDTSNPDAPRFSIPLEDPKAEENLPTILQSINSVLASVGMRFAGTQGVRLENKPVDIPVNGHGMLTLDPRERCGAIVFERISEDERQQLEAMFHEALGDLGEHANHFYHVSKNVVLPDGRVNGYIDLKPGGMSKGKTVLQLLDSDHFRDRVSARTHFIVAGDSGPDLEMMEAVTKRFGQGRVTNIWVGNDRAVYDYDGQHPGMTFWNLPGCQVTSIAAMYNMLRSAATPVRRVQDPADNQSQQAPTISSSSGIITPAGVTAHPV